MERDCYDWYCFLARGMGRDIGDSPFVSFSFAYDSRVKNDESSIQPSVYVYEESIRGVAAYLTVVCHCPRSDGNSSSRLCSTDYAGKNGQPTAVKRRELDVTYVTQTSYPYSFLDMQSQPICPLFQRNPPSMERVGLLFLIHR